MRCRALVVMDPADDDATDVEIEYEWDPADEAHGWRGGAVVERVVVLETGEIVDAMDLSGAAHDACLDAAEDDRG